MLSFLKIAVIIKIVLLKSWSKELFAV